MNGLVIIIWTYRKCSSRYERADFLFYNIAKMQYISPFNNMGILPKAALVKAQSQFYLNSKFACHIKTFVMER